MKIQHKFYKGLNKDSDHNNYNPESYYDAVNLRPLTEDGLSNMTLQNVKGNKDITVIDNNFDRTGYTVINVSNVNEDLILFYVAEDNSGYTIIDLLKYERNYDRYHRILLWNGYELNLFTSDELETITRAESDYNIKLYWIDKKSPLKSLNIAPDENSDPFDVNSYTRVNSTSSFSIEVPPFNKYGEIAKDLYNWEYISGNIPVGKIQYAYKVYKEYGGSSFYSPPSGLFPLFKGNSTNTSSFYVEDGEDTNSYKGIKFNIVLPDEIVTLYDYIEVIALHYTSNTENPSIYLVDTLEIKKASISIVDNGDYSGTISLAEYNALQLSYVPKHMEIKDNIMFLGNLSETYFDIDEYLGYYYDTRAIRFDANRIAKVTNQDAVEDLYEFDAVNDPNWASRFPDDSADMVNVYNIPHYDGLLNKFYKYQSDGSTIGGEGPNISYRIYDQGVSYMETDVDESSPFKVNCDINIEQSTNDYVLGVKANLQEDEIYRFGIVFFDDKGRQSYVKWIADVRVNGSNDLFTIIDSTNVRARTLYIGFKFKNFPDKLKNLSYQFVYVPRKREDRTVLLEGIAGKTHFYLDAGGTNSYGIDTFRNVLYSGASNIYAFNSLKTESGTLTPTSYNDVTFITLFSPEITNGVTVSEDNLYVEHLYSITDEEVKEYKSRIMDDSYLQSGQSPAKSNFEITSTFTRATEYTVKNKNKGDVKNVINHKYSTTEKSYNTFSKDVTFYTKTSSLIDTENAFNETPDTTAASNLLGSCLILEVESAIGDSNSFGYELSNTGNYVRLRKKIIPYGGYNRIDRSNNEYIGFSKVLTFQGENVTQYVYNGDVFHVPYVYLKTLADTTLNQTVYVGNSLIATPNTVTRLDVFTTQNQIKAYVRSSINTYFNDLGINGNSNTSFLAQEQAGKYTKAFNIVNEYSGNTEYSTRELTLNQEKNLYNYNSAFSELGTARKYYPKPNLYKDKKEYNTKIIFSLVKTDDESIDNWTQYLPNNFNNVNRRYGQITKIVEFKDNIYIFQEDGFCLASINPRVTQVGDDGISTVLGTGEILDNFKYISSEIGCSTKSDIIKSENGIYWLHGNDIYKFNGQSLEKISFTKNMSSWFNKTINNNSYLHGINDDKNKDIILSIQNKSFTNIETLQTKEYFYQKSRLVFQFDKYYSDQGSRTSEAESSIQFTLDSIIYTITFNDQVSSSENNNATINWRSQFYSTFIYDVLIQLLSVNELNAYYSVIIEDYDDIYSEVTLISRDGGNGDFNESNTFTVPVVKTTEYNNISNTSTDIVSYSIPTILDDSKGILEEYNSIPITHRLILYNNDHLFRVGKRYFIYGFYYVVHSINRDSNTVYLVLDSDTNPTQLGEINLDRNILSHNNYTLAFNEALNYFTSFYSYNNNLYIRTPEKLFSYFDLSLWEHNKGEFNTFYNNTSNSYLDIVSSSPEVSEFTNIELKADVFRDKEFLEDKTICAIQAYNNEQLTDEVRQYPISDTRIYEDTSGYDIANNGESSNGDNKSYMWNIRKNISKWNAQVPRDRSDYYEVTEENYLLSPIDYSLTSDRIRGNHVVLRFTFDPLNTQCRKEANFSSFECSDNGSDEIAISGQDYTIRKTITRIDTNASIDGSYSITFDFGVLGTQIKTGNLSVGESENIEITKTLTGIIGSYTISWSGSCDGTRTLNILIGETLFLTTDSEIKFYDETIVINDINYSGSAVLSISNNKLICTTAGTVFNLEINNGDYYLPCAETNGWTLHDVRLIERMIVNNHSWLETENIYYNFVNGYTELDNGTKIPYNELKQKIYNDL